MNQPLSTAAPFEIPKGACDCHMHIVGPLDRYPFKADRSLSPPEALWESYQQTAGALGIERCVIVQPSFFGSDNACTLDSVARSGAAAAVGVVVLDPSVTSEQIRALHQQGARAVRSQMIVAGGMPFSALEAVAHVIAPFGWHLELYVDSQDLPSLSGLLRKLPVPVVFDHMGQWLPGDRTDEEGFLLMLDMVSSGRAWTKLSNPRFQPSTQRARMLIEANADRVVWGSDWPHVSYHPPLPDDRELLSFLGELTDDEALLQKILVTNPQNLYFSNI
jgi:predicted TIM-barrel fold metal-dependent hydrolase